MRNPAECTIAETKMVSHYIETGDLEGAFEAAFGYSRRTVGYENSARVWRKPRVQMLYATMRAQLEERLKIDRETVQDELAAIAFSNIADFLDHDGETVTLKALGELTRSQSRAIKSVTVVDGHLKLEFHDKNTALKQLSKVLGLEQGDVNVNVQNFVIRAPETAASSEIWEQQAKHFLDADADDGEAEPALPSPAAPAEPQAATPYPPEPQTAVRDYGGPEQRPEPQAKAEAPRPNPKYRYR